uniref:Uncharacterized protein n=1 Tax=Anguilla anguilla TaxID=7936 RepID=A0A0E9UAG7_ANGAN
MNSHVNHIILNLYSKMYIFTYFIFKILHTFARVFSQFNKYVVFCYSLLPEVSWTQSFLRV